MYNVTVIFIFVRFYIHLLTLCEQSCFLHSSLLTLIFSGWADLPWRAVANSFQRNGWLGFLLDQFGRTIGHFKLAVTSVNDDVLPRAKSRLGGICVCVSACACTCTAVLVPQCHFLVHLGSFWWVTCGCWPARYRTTSDGHGVMTECVNYE